MKDGFIKIAAATPKIKVADCVFNAQSIISEVFSAAEKGVKLLVLPELCVTGYTCGDLFFQKTLIDGAENAVSDIVAKTSALDIVFVVGAPVFRNGKLLNAAIVIYKGKVLGTVSKRHLPNYNEFYEKRHFSVDQNEMPQVFRCANMNEFCFGVEICEDLWSVDPPSTELARMGANIILNLSASNEMIGKSDYRRKLVEGQSGRLICAYAFASAGDGESTTDMVFSGHNIITENSTILAESKLFENGIIATEVDVQKLSYERRKNTSFPPCTEGGVLFDMPVTETKLSRFIPTTPFTPTQKNDLDSRAAQILLMQSSGLKKRLEHTGAKTAVIGISGGLDSSLALLVCVKAMDLLNRPHTDIIAVTMPCFGTTSRTKSNAEKLCECLGVTFREIDISDSVRQHFTDINHDINNLSVVFENGQARERTQVLMDIANETWGMVIGTGDLSELALGWATYNGDHMSMYGVNASVPKTLIRHIVRYYADTSGNKELSDVLNDILATPVSPELLPAEKGEISQKTEDLVGPYELHDFFLYYAIRWGFPPKKVFRLALYAFANAYDRETVLKWLKTFYRRFFSQQFKRSCLPDSPKIGSVTLSPRADWRMPSDASSAMWLSELEQL